MSTDSARHEVRERLFRISGLAAEIASVQSIPQDVWTMKEIAKKAEQIREDSHRVAVLLGLSTP